MQSLPTSAKCAVSMYLIPPQARLDEFMLVRPAKSPRSISATCAPLPARAAALTAPLIPPPTISTSKRWWRSFVRLFLRSCMRLELQYPPSLLVEIGYFRDPIDIDGALDVHCNTHRRGGGV